MAISGVLSLRDMFTHINKKGMEVVLQFLFSRLDCHLAYEDFRLRPWLARECQSRELRVN